MKKIILNIFIYALARIYCSENNTQESESLKSNVDNSEEKFVTLEISSEGNIKKEDDLCSPPKSILIKTATVLRDLEMEIGQEVSNTFNEMIDKIYSEDAYKLGISEEIIDFFVDISKETTDIITNLSIDLNAQFHYLVDEFKKNTHELFLDTAEQLKDSLNLLEKFHVDGNYQDVVSLKETHKLVSQHLNNLSNSENGLLAEFIKNYVENIENSIATYQSSIEKYEETCKSRFESILQKNNYDEDDIDGIMIITLEIAELELFNKLKEYLENARKAILVVLHCYNN